MPIKAADVVHIGRGSFLLSRLQNVGPGGLQIPTEVIHEAGNYKSVGVIRDVPDLSFTMNSFDVSTTIEQLLTATTSVTSSGIDMTFMKALTIVGQVKPGAQAGSPFDVLKSVACPLLFPERISYRAAVQQSSTVDVTLRGSAIYYNPAAGYQKVVAGTGTSGQTITLDHAAGLYDKNGTLTRVLSVDVDGQRLDEGVDFTVTVPSGEETNDYSVPTIHLSVTVAATANITVVYFSSATLSIPQSDHPLASALPAANKGRDVRVYVGATYDPAHPESSAANRWTGVQSVSVDLTNQIIKDFELGAADPTTIEPQDVPSLSGSVTVRARNAEELFTRLRQITGVTNAARSSGPDNAVELALDIVFLDAAGTVYKRLHVADARFSLPGYSAQVQQRVDFDMQWVSDTGGLKVYSA